MRLNVESVPTAPIEWNAVLPIMANISDIITAIAAIITVAIAGIAAGITYREFSHSKDRKSREKAVELARLFQLELPKIALIEVGFKATGFSEYLAERFNWEQFGALEFCQSEMAELIEFEGSIEDFVKDYYSRLNAIPDFTTKNTSTTISAGQLRYIIGNSLNFLEWFSMNFISEVADHEIVYQSLHQVFLSTVGILYVHIACLNKDGANQYYTNIIDLYKIWREKQIEAAEKEKQIEEESKKIEIDARKNAVHRPKGMKK